MKTSTTIVSVETEVPNPVNLLVLSTSESESKNCDSVQVLMHAVINSGVSPLLPKEKLKEMLLGYGSLSNPTYRQQSILLHQLIYDVLYPSIKDELEDEQINLLFDFEDQAKKVLEEILPKGTDIQDYLKQLSIEKVVIERLILYRNFYQSQLVLLNQSAEAVNFKMIAKFEEVRSQFLKFSAKTEVLNESLKMRIEEMSKKIHHLGKHYEEVRAKAQNSADDFNGLQDTIKHNSRTLI